MSRLTVEVEVCPRCLGPESGSDPECPECAVVGVVAPVVLRVEASGEWEPAEAASWSEWDGGHPGCDGGWDGSPDRITRSDTGAEVLLSDLPDPTLAGIDAALLEAAEQYEAGAADRDAADRAMEREDWRIDR